MKKSFITAILTIMFAISCFLPLNVSYANSALMQSDAKNEHFELLPLKDDDISVESEILTFDFTKGDKELEHYSPISQTTALYDMRNAGDDKIVTMGFPLVSTIDTFKNYTTEIKLNEQNIDFIPYYAFAEANNIVNLTFEEILDGLNQMQREDTKQIGHMYKIRLADITKGELASVEFNMSSESMMIYDFSGFGFQENRVNYSNYKITLETRTNYLPSYEKEFVYFYVIGEQVTDLKAHALDKNRKIIDSYSLDVVEVSSLRVGEYILSLREEMTPAEVDIIAAKLYERQDSISVSESELINSVYSAKCLILLGYTVTLKGQSVPNMLSVSYPMDGAFSAYYEPTLYTYNYISSPAKNWASFGSFTVNIYTNPDNPYVINTNLEYAKVAENAYQYVGNGIPKGNLEFSICASESPQYSKRAKGSFGAAFWIKTIILAVVIISGAGLIVSTVIIIVKKHKAKKPNKENNGKDINT
jgi:hypothetical protein